MTNVHFDSYVADDERRQRIYDGDIFVYAPTQLSLELVAFADEMIRAAFGVVLRRPRKARWKSRSSPSCWRC